MRAVSQARKARKLATVPTQGMRIGYGLSSCQREDSLPPNGIIIFDVLVLFSVAKAESFPTIDTIFLYPVSSYNFNEKVSYLLSDFTLPSIYRESLEMFVGRVGIIDST